MKAVQVLFDEALLARLDADDEVRTDGRSAVLRRAAAEYLRRRRARKTAEAYRRAYGKRDRLDDELQGWPAEGAWPEN
jgi:metal-responsive CopG/Arc/MetJ family transcriptional regulator